MRKLLGALAVSIWLAASLLSAGATIAQSEQLRVGLVDSPQGFDPALAVVGASHQAIDLVFSGLTRLDNNSDPQPDLATAWEVDESGTVFKFNLRDDVTFHDGVPLTADDVVFTFERLMDPETGYPYAIQVESFKSVRAVDTHTVELILTRPTGPLLTFLAFPGNFIVPKHVVEAGDSLNSTPIGTGPYRFVSYSPNQELLLERNLDYYVDGFPKMDLKVSYIPDDTERTNALLGGTIDFASRVGPKDYDLIVDTEGFSGSETIGGRWYSLLTNVEAPITDNALVRKAISFALDRQAMLDVLFFGHGQAMLGGPIPNWSWAYDPSTDMVPINGDIDKAKELLAEAGYPDGVDIDVTLSSSWRNLLEQGPLLKEMLERANIRVNLISMENPRWIDEVWVGGKYQVANNYWLSPLADPDDFIYLSYKCGSGMNAQRYCSEKFDELVEEGRYTLDKEGRKKFYVEATKLLNEELPLIPTINAGILDTFSDNVQGWEPMRTGMYRNLGNVTLAK